MRYLSIPEIIVLHARLIQQTGGSPGIRDLGLLESAAARLQMTFDGVDLYANVVEKAATLLESLCQNHAFIDGNKRIALAATGIFLELNGLILDVSNEAACEFVMEVARGRRSVTQIAEWLDTHVHRTDQQGDSV